MARNEYRDALVNYRLDGMSNAGWTERKQALHDMITGCYVTFDD